MVTWLADLGINWNSQTGGMIIGSCAAALVSMLGAVIIQIFREVRPKKNRGSDLRALPDLPQFLRSSLNERLYYERETRQEQFEYDRERDIVGRRIKALEDLQQLLDEQFRALASLWSCYRADKMKVLCNVDCDERFDILVEKQYLRKAWSADTSLRRNLNKYTNACDELIGEFIHNQAMDHEPFFKSTASELGLVIHELPNLMSRLSDIEMADSVVLGDAVSRLMMKGLCKVEA